MKDKRSDYSTLRKQIAACTRIMNMEGLIDYSGHISVRLPHNDGILIQSYDDSRATLEPDRLLVGDLKGNVIPDEIIAFRFENLNFDSEIDEEL